MTSIPNALSLATIVDGGPEVAAPLRNNFGDVQTAVNALLAFLATGTTGQVFTSGGPAAIAWGGSVSKTTVGLLSAGPPGSPADGDIWVATAVDTGNITTTNGTRWAFQYNSSSTSTYKWEFIGGSDIEIPPTSGFTATNGSWQEAAFYAVPRAGDYKVVLTGGSFLCGSGGGSFNSGVSIAAANPAVNTTANPPNGLNTAVPGIEQLLTGFTATQHASLMAKGTSGTGNDYGQVCGYVRPVRII